MTKRRGKEPRAIRLKVVLTEPDPPIWREIVVDERSTLQQLHDTLQVAFGFLNYHLFEFEINDIRYEAPDPEAEGKDASVAALSGLGLKLGSDFLYRYDFGDDWTFTVEVVGIEALGPNAWLPWIIEGERAGPPEDSGGVWGFQEMLAALNDPVHPEHEEFKTWVGPGYDPEHFDLRAANKFLALASSWGILGVE